MAVEQLISNHSLNELEEIPKDNYPNVTREMFERAIRGKTPSITSSTLRQYENFRVGE